MLSCVFIEDFFNFTPVFTCVSLLRGQRLKEVLQLHEFRRETSELEDWMNQQRQTAESQDLGSDYQHVQVSRAQQDNLNISSMKM